MSLLKYYRDTVAGISDELPYAVNGQVIRPPDWYDPRFEHYFGASPQQYAPMKYPHEERMVILAVFTLLALAIIFRR